MRIPAEYTGKHKGCGGQVVFRPVARRRELLAGESVMLSAVCRTCGERITTRYSLRDGARPTARSMRDAGAVASLVDHRAAADATRARLRTRVELPLAAGAEHMATSTWIAEVESAPASVRAASTGLELLDEPRADEPRLSLVAPRTETVSAPLDHDTQEHLDAFVQRLAAARQRVRDVLDHELPDPGLWRERASAPAGVVSEPVAVVPEAVVPTSAPMPTAIEDEPAVTAFVPELVVAVEPEPVVAVAAEVMAVEPEPASDAAIVDEPPVALAPEPPTVVDPEVPVAAVPEPVESAEAAPESEPEPVAVAAPEPVAVEPAVEPVAVEPVAMEPVAVEPVAMEPVVAEAVDSSVEASAEPLPSPIGNPHDLPAPIVAEGVAEAPPTVPTGGAEAAPLPAPIGPAYPQLAAPLPAPSGPAYPTLPAPVEAHSAEPAEIATEPLPAPTGTRYDLPAPVSPMTSSQPPVPVPDDGYPRSSYAQAATVSEKGRGFDWGAEDEPETVGRAAATRTGGSRGKVILLAVTMLIVMTVAYLGASKFIFAADTSGAGSQPTTTESSAPADAAQGGTKIVQGKAPKATSDATAQQQDGGTTGTASGTGLKDGASNTDGTATSATDDPFAPKG